MLHGSTSGYSMKMKVATQHLKLLNAFRLLLFWKKLLQQKLSDDINTFFSGDITSIVFSKTKQA
jgi:hypothetical protein